MVTEFRETQSMLGFKSTSDASPSPGLKKNPKSQERGVTKLLQSKTLASSLKEPAWKEEHVQNDVMKEIRQQQVNQELQEVN